MSRVCEITWKRTWVGNTRSKSMRACRRKYFPNLFFKNITDPETWLVYRIKVSAKGLKTLKKKWIM